MAQDETTAERTPLWVSRITRLPVLDADGATIGAVTDLVFGAPLPGAAPPVHGFVCRVNRREVFLHATRVARIAVDGVHLRGGTVDLRGFRLRAGELTAQGQLVGRRLGDLVVRDVGIAPRTSRAEAWELAAIGLGRPGLVRRRRPARVLAWREAGPVLDFGPGAADLARVRALHPADAAEHMASLTDERRDALARSLDDAQLADIFEELPEAVQVEIIEGLEVSRAAHVLDEMETDDAADLLAELPLDERRELLSQMPEEEAARLRLLLAYGNDTAGGLMTVEPVVVESSTTVAEAIARVRHRELAAVLSAQIFVADRPTEPPTGRYLGTVTTAELLRQAPGEPVGPLVRRDTPVVAPHDLLALVAQTFARYDLLCLAVVDRIGRLVGVVTVDDVLARVLARDTERAKTGRI